MADPNLRRSVRAIVLDEWDRVLLCRFDLPSQGVIVWAPPGGGVEHDETPLQALCRELDEEVGLALVDEPPLVWHQRVVAQGHAEGYDGVINDYYLIETESFQPHGSFSADALRAENINELRWWTLDELQAYRGGAVFGPRNLVALLSALLTDGAPDKPLALGL